jgi:BMFP domain-containing protein YqiC
MRRRERQQVTDSLAARFSNHRGEVEQMLAQQYRMINDRLDTVLATVRGRAVGMPEPVLDEVRVVIREELDVLREELDVQITSITEALSHTKAMIVSLLVDDEDQEEVVGGGEK